MTQLNESPKSIFSLYPDEISHLVNGSGKLPKFRVKQLLEWIFTHREHELANMSNLPKSLRDSLASTFDWSMPELMSKLDGSDGATKLLLRGSRQQIFEAVILRYEGRTSLCVSSQVGCKLACSFCQTGKLGFFRNLSAEEIVGQFLLANKILEPESRKISHIVFMGMGEPLDNFEHVVKAVNLFTRADCYGLSARRVTVSTSGITPKIGLLAEQARASLAVSLHAARDDLRSELMPINRRYPLAVLKEQLVSYQEKTGEKITIEYILIKNKNCGIREAKELVRFLHGLRAKVNLIPFNSHPGMDYDRPEESDILLFQKYLSKRGYPAPVRYSKGLGVSAACGQLAAKHQQNLSDAPRRKSVVNQSL
ncbi:MAG: 23S rRNA (adenine(2503)-C(2))-methyltransferase RlmN [Oligoflexales bacterium]